MGKYGSVVDELLDEGFSGTPNNPDEPSSKYGSVVDEMTTMPIPGQQKTAPTEDKGAWLSILSEAVKNTPGSAVQYAKDVITPFLHPVETVKTTGALGLEPIMGALGGSEAEEMAAAGGAPQQGNIDALIGFMKDRYGSIDNFKQTVSKDPVGVLGDISSILIPGGKGIRAAGVASKLKPVQAVGKAISKAGQVLEPTTLLKKASQVIPTERMYLGATKLPAVKPKPGMTAVQRKMQMARTAIDNAVLPTVKGLEKLSDKIDSIDRKIGALVDAPTKAGVTKSAKELIKDFGELERNTIFSGTSQDALKGIRNIKKQFMDTWSTVDKEGVRTWKTINPEQIQKLKVQIYRELKSTYNTITEQPASIDAQKAIARSAKTMMEEIVPEIKGLNKKYGPMKDLEESLGKAISQRIINRDIMGIGLPIKAVAGSGAGAAMAGGMGAAVGTGVGLVLGIIDTPTVKAALAIMIDRMQKAGKIVPGRKTEILNKLNKLMTPEIMSGAFQAGRAERVLEQE